MNWEEFIKIWQESEPHPKPIFFRLYYNDQGQPLSYSMEDMPGNYIDIDALTYQRSDFNVRVVDGKLVDIPKRTTVIKLKPVGTGTPCDHTDVTVVVNSNEPNIKWDKTYEN
jgi:hypothetical protein